MRSIQAAFIALCLGLLWYSGFGLGQWYARPKPEPVAMTSCGSCHLLDVGHASMRLAVVEVRRP
jgi:hypothetical protein